MDQPPRNSVYALDQDEKHASPVPSSPVEQDQAPQTPPPQRGIRVPPTEEEIATCPWKYAGYAQFSRWVASDKAWLITRRFGTINARIILLLQDNIVQLEDELNRLDEKYSQSHRVMGDDNMAHNGSFRLESFSDRADVLDKLVTAVSKYNSFINEYSKLASHPLVREDDVHAVRTWLGNNRHAINDVEAAYITPEYNDDLIPIHPKARPWFQQIRRSPLLRRFLLRGFLKRKPCDPMIGERERDTIWHNERIAEWVSTTVISIVGLGLIIGPIWALYEIKASKARMGIISGFIVLFYILVGMTTTAKVFESLAAVAAYAAVLMVFMQIQNQ